MQVWNFADFAAVQSIMSVDGLNMKGVFTRSRIGLLFHDYTTTRQFVHQRIGRLCVAGGIGGLVECWP